MFGVIRVIRGASTHGEDSGSCGGRGCSSGILDCLFVMSQVSVEEKRWEALRERLNLDY